MITIKTRDTVVRIIRGKPPGRPFALTPAQEREMIRRHMLNGEKMVDLCKAYGGISGFSGIHRCADAILYNVDLEAIDVALLTGCAANGQQPALAGRYRMAGP